MPAKRASKKANATAAAGGSATTGGGTEEHAAAEGATAPKTAAAGKSSGRTAVAAKAAAKKASAASGTAKRGATTRPAPKATVKQTEPTKTARSRVKTATAPDLPADAEHLRDVEWLEQQRLLLLEERAQYTRSADSLAAEAAALMADREPGDVQFDEESGEGDTLAVERDRDLALSAAARNSVEQIDLALARIAAGTYGICVMGGDIIPKERLEAIPEAAVCVTHKVGTFS